MAIVIPSKYIFSPKHQNAVGNNINGIEYSVYTEPRNKTASATPITIDFYKDGEDGKIKFFGNRKIDYVERLYTIYNNFSDEVLAEGDFISDKNTYAKTADGSFKPLTETAYTVEPDKEENSWKINFTDKWFDLVEADGSHEYFYSAYCTITINAPTGFEVGAQKMNVNMRTFYCSKAGDVLYLADNYLDIEKAPVETFSHSVEFKVYGLVEGDASNILKYAEYKYDLFYYEFGTSTYQSKATAPFKFDENIFFHSANLYDGKPFMENLSSKILNKYQNGTEMIELSCIVGNYYDENGEKVISIDNDNLPMIFKNGDIVKPMRKSISGDAPISENENSESNLFQVISVGFEYNGAIYQKLVLQQTK